MATGRVKIGPNFFKKAFQDYSDWQFAMVREACQNCIDAPGSNNILLDVKRDGENTVFIFANDGAPMTEEELVDKFLALGESGKDDNTTVGGMGKAKEILCFCHLRYEIITGDLRVVGSGGDYELEHLDKTSPECYQGTITKVLIKGNHYEDLYDHARSFIYMTQWHGWFTLNGKDYQGKFRKGSPRREFKWGTVYTNRGFSDRLVVRIKGVPMFTRHLECGGKCVLVELTGRSTEVLQSNRDGLKWDIRSQLDSFVDSITVDKRSALGKDEETTYMRFAGDKLQVCRAAQQVMAQLVGNAPQAMSSDPYAEAAYATKPEYVPDDEEEEAVVRESDVATTDYRPTMEYAGDREDHVQRQELRRSQITHEFILKNETGMDCPTYYLPISFSQYSKRVIGVWAKCLLELHRLFDREATFSVGFILHEKEEAEYERSPEYGEVFYINPSVVVHQKASRSRSLSNRWNLTPAGKMAILSSAVHEFCHALGYGPHDEGYANKVTELFAVVLANIKRFYPAFR